MWSEGGRRGGRGGVAGVVSWRELHGGEDNEMCCVCLNVTKHFVSTPVHAERRGVQ